MADLAQLSECLKDFRDERDWKQFHTLKNLSIALSIEASELAELMLWKTDEEINEKLLEKKFRKSVEDECADVLNYLLLISSQVGFNLVDAAFEKIKENDQKYPVKKSFGTAKKYTEL